MFTPGGRLAPLWSLLLYALAILIPPVKSAPTPVHVSSIYKRDPTNPLYWLFIVALGIVTVSIVLFIWWRGSYKMNPGVYGPTDADLVACWNQKGYNHIMHFDWRGRIDGWAQYNGDPATIPPGWELGGRTARERKMRTLWEKYGVRPRHFENQGGSG